jgi:phage tail tape-measure protein
MATDAKTVRTNDPAVNPDPITKAPGAHPMGAGVGAAVGGAAVGGAAAAIAVGAAAGSVAGPIGTVVGAIGGAVVGGMVGKDVAERVNPSAEHEYWKSNYSTRPYARDGAPYDEYAPAYQYGWESRQKNAGKNFSQIEQDLGQGWDKAKGKSKLGWSDAKGPTRDAWDRIDSNNRSQQS